MTAELPSIWIEAVSPVACLVLFCVCICFYTLMSKTSEEGYLQNCLKETALCFVNECLYVYVNTSPLLLFLFSTEHPPVFLRDELVYTQDKEVADIRHTVSCICNAN